MKMADAAYQCMHHLECAERGELTIGEARSLCCGAYESRGIVCPHVRGHDLELSRRRQKK